jgi:hypothetical protein
MNTTTEQRTTLPAHWWLIGAIGGMLGGVVIWIYEALVWVSVQHQMPLSGIPRNAVGLVFGPDVQTNFGWFTYVLGTGIHFFFSIAWGVLFARTWPWFRRRGHDATLVAMFYAVFAWIVMHGLIALVSDSHPDYLDSVVIIGGFMSHFFFTVPLALYVKARMP